MNTSNFVDYYKILNISENSSTEQIKKAYRTLARKYHPDACLEESAEVKKEYEEKFKQINDAYEILSDDLKRIEYDKLYTAYQKRKRQEKRQKESTKTKNTQKTSKESPPFVNNIVNAYKDIKKEEAKNPFSKRHSRLDKEINKYLKNKEYFNLKRGILHIFSESIFQLEKLTHITEDTIPKYVLRNRKIIGAMIATTFIVSGFSNKDTNEIPMSNESTIESLQNKMSFISNEDGYVNLTRYYKVKAGDTLTALSKDSNIDIYRLADINSCFNGLLYTGDHIFIPYKIAVADLDFYLYKVKYDYSMSLDEFAKAYETTKEDIIALNSEAIVNINGNEVVLSEYLNVPNFITKDQLQTLKYQKQK